MTTIIGRDDIGAWKASYLAQRFEISIEEAKQLKLGEPIEIANAKAEKIVEQGFGRVINAEPDPVKKTKAKETEADNGD